MAIIATCITVGLIIYAAERWAWIIQPAGGRPPPLDLPTRLWGTLTRPMQTTDLTAHSINFSANFIILIFAFQVLILVTLYTANTGAWQFFACMPRARRAACRPAPPHSPSLDPRPAPRHPLHTHSHRAPPAAANLTASQLENRIRSINDLPGKVVATWDDPGYMDTLKARGITAVGYPWATVPDLQVGCVRGRRVGRALGAG